MRSDAELLLAHASGRSDDAFNELLRRHVDLVYSAALRQVGGDAHLAKDVTQVVFIELARRAGSLGNLRSLAGWLYTTAHHTAAKMVRGERRRRAREQEAQLMHSQNAGPGSATDWDALRPVLDSAMLELDGHDREAVLLRYFAGRSFEQVGATLGLSADTARKRVERALDTLHGLLARRGVTSTAAALGLAIASNAVARAPGEIERSVTQAAIAETGLHLGATTGAAGLFIMKKIHVGLVLALAGLALVWQVQRRALAEVRSETGQLRVQFSQVERTARSRAIRGIAAPAPYLRPNSLEDLDIAPLPRSVSARPAWNRLQLDTTLGYAPLFRSLKLPADKLNILKDLLVEREAAVEDVALFAKRTTQRMLPTERIELEEVGTAAVDERVRELLGEDAFAYYRQFQRTKPWRRVFDDFEGLVTIAGATPPFTDAQVDQLAAWAREAAPDHYGAYALSGSAAIPDLVIQRGANILTPGQWQILKNLQAADLSRRRMVAMKVEYLVARGGASEK